MRRPALAGAAILAATAEPAFGDIVKFTATLTGDVDTSARPTAPRGSAMVSLDTATKTATWTVEYSGLSGTAHGLSCGALDSLRGPPIQQSGTLKSPITGSKPLNDAEIAGLASGRWVCVVDGENDDAEIGGALKPAR